MSDYEDAPLLIMVVAGCLAGAIETTATWPCEYIKTQLQLQHPPLERKHKPTVWVNDHTYIIEEDGHIEQLPPPYTRMIPGILHVIRTEGFWNLYLGLTPTLLGSIPKAGIRFGLFACFQELLRGDNGELSISMHFLAGFAAGVVEAFVIVVPVETIKTKCIELNLSFLRGLQEIIAMEGICGIYHGLIATLLKQGSNHGLRFMWYHEFVRVVTNDGTSQLTVIQSFLGGMTAGIFSALGNQPFDVLKTRMQGIHAEEEYSSTLDCVMKTFQTEGIPGFYKGLIPRLFRVIPGQGIIFMSFEIIVKILVAIFG